MAETATTPVSDVAVGAKEGLPSIESPSPSPPADTTSTTTPTAVTGPTSHALGGSSNSTGDGTSAIDNLQYGQARQQGPPFQPRPKGFFAPQPPLIDSRGLDLDSLARRAPTFEQIVENAKESDSFLLAALDRTPEDRHFLLETERILLGLFLPPRNATTVGGVASVSPLG